jgi:hypothetical protein
MPDPTRRERILEAIALLTEHNRWRRGEEIDQQNPFKIGQAIDILGEVKDQLKESILHRQAVANLEAIKLGGALIPKTKEDEGQQRLFDSSETES